MSGADTSPQVGVILSVDPDRFTRTVEAARRAGLHVTSEQPLLGSLSGTVAENRIPALAAVDGVLSVDRDRPVSLPPPDTPVP
ncbi:hypothetical protein [Streptomyces griseoloalbus]|uniref:Uncharacterized protein n=1 Tax=Streptomyces griseoloalbus TaxID=67303 RepID=A0A7W8BU12_9ACTN|nr:hypothetical protein [Streptomyces albaduncus]MBB5128738.1 hypothetical protein [Streptomyces albaduncus]GGV73664.1 hypothetical protein GCM10010294_36110 [Streptomyces griseoloalbus]GGW46392.1 hypothetical protein GCM10010340_25580 [Streptomyces albaduncus]